MNVSGRLFRCCFIRILKDFSISENRKRSHPPASSLFQISSCSVEPGPERKRSTFSVVDDVDIEQLGVSGPEETEAITRFI